jgi:hypothetical protein
MSRHFDVVGDEDLYDASDNYEVYDQGGAYMMGAAGMRRMPRGIPPRGRALRMPPRPGWRDQLAPGVIQPDEGMIPLPLQALSNNGTFAAGVSQITWQGQLQKPFRGERLLISVVRTGASAVGRLLGLVWVGTDLQQADISGFDLELYGAATAFGTRLTMKPAQPGVLIRVVVTPSAIPTGTDTIFASVSIAGRVIH